MNSDRDSQEDEIGSDSLNGELVDQLAAWDEALRVGSEPEGSGPAPPAGLLWLMTLRQQLGRP